jgi:hypothetical protein
VGIAPTGRLVRVLVYIPTSSLTGIAWSLPRSAVLFRQTCRNMPGFTGPMTGPSNTRIARGSIPASAIASEQSDQEEEASERPMVFVSHIRAPDERILRSPSR